MKENSPKVTRRQMLRYLGSGVVVGGAGKSKELMAMIERAYEDIPAERVVDMEYRRFGQTGMKLSPMGLGGLLAHFNGAFGHPPPEEKRQIYLRAAELGINLFDMGYGDEVYIPEELKGNRGDLYFSLKVGAPRATDLEGKVDKHLENLRRDAIDILRVHSYAYANDSQLAEKIAELKQAGKVRSLCLIRHYEGGPEVYAEHGPVPEADADLVMYSYVYRGQEPGIEKSAEAGKGVLTMKALGGQFVSWENKSLTDWSEATMDTFVQLSPLGESVRDDILYLLTAGPWHELAGPEELIPGTDAAVRWVLKNQNVSSVLVAVASVEELEEALGLMRSTTSVQPAIPKSFKLFQNRPNPFNPTTTISFSLVEAGNVNVDIYNAAGQKVDTLVNKFMDAGSHSIVWNASDFSAGVYFYTVKSGDFSRTMKMTLVK